MYKIPRIKVDPKAHPYKTDKRRRIDYDRAMAFHPSITTNPVLNKQFLAPPSALPRKTSQHTIQPIQPARNVLDEFLSSDLDLDLELSFASTMSLNSPPRGPATLASENNNPNYTPMDISPAPQRILSTKPTGRPRALTGDLRLFGKDLSNSTESLPLTATGNRNASETKNGKRLQRAALPTEWMSFEDKNLTQVSWFRFRLSARTELGRSTADSSSLDCQPMDIPSSPGMGDAMDVDLSFGHVASSSAPEEHGPLSSAPTITAFQLHGHPGSDAHNNPFLDEMENAQDESDLSGIVESPSQPFPKKRRSSSPKPQAIRTAYQHLLEEESLSSSPAPPSSPSDRKVERIASAGLKKPLPGLGAIVELNANKKRPRRPALSSVIAPTESLMPQTAYPVMTSGAHDKENSGAAGRGHVLPPVRRAFSAMLPPSALEQAFEEGSSYEADGAEMSSPAQAHAHRQQMKTIRRCDGTEDFRPLTGATALVRRETQAILKGLKRNEDKEDSAREKEPGKGDTPRSRYLNAGPGLGGFGDNEAGGKILPCHRVREDGLMRITAETVSPPKSMINLVRDD